MTGQKQQNDQQDELRDLDVPEKDADGVKGEGGMVDYYMPSVETFKVPRSNNPNVRGQS